MQSKERFSIECRPTKTKVIKRPIEAEEYTPKLQEKSRQPLVWEHPDDQFATRFRSASDWLKVWREFSAPITERSKETLNNLKLLKKLS